MVVCALKVAPVCRLLPPVAAAYQNIVSPVPAVADKATFPVFPHLKLFPAIGAAGDVLFIVNVTGILVAEVHPPNKVLDSA